MSEQTQDELMAAVTRRAMEVLELPDSERGERYALMHRIHYDTARETGAEHDRALDWADRMDEWIKAMVAMTGGQSPTRD